MNNVFFIGWQHEKVLFVNNEKGILYAPGIINAAREAFAVYNKENVLK